MTARERGSAAAVSDAVGALPFIAAKSGSGGNRLEGETRLCRGAQKWQLVVLPATCAHQTPAGLFLPDAGSPGRVRRIDWCRLPTKLKSVQGLLNVAGLCRCRYEDPDTGSICVIFDILQNIQYRLWSWLVAKAAEWWSSDDDTNGRPMACAWIVNTRKPRPGILQAKRTSRISIRYQSGWAVVMAGNPRTRSPGRILFR